MVFREIQTNMLIEDAYNNDIRMMDSQWTWFMFMSWSSLRLCPNVASDPTYGGVYNLNPHVDVVLIALGARFTGRRCPVSNFNAQTYLSCTVSAPRVLGLVAGPAYSPVPPWISGQLLRDLSGPWRCAWANYGARFMYIGHGMSSLINHVYLCMPLIFQTRDIRKGGGY
jgi:hypothetical protein